jgi:hypothetical protein
MIWQKSTSKFVSIGIALVFLFNTFNELKPSESSNDCVAAYDQFGYYAYLPATFIYNDLAFQKSWKDSLQSNYCSQNIVYQFVDVEQGKKVNMYHMGLSYIHLPGFLLANSLAKPFGYKQDGMSFPYRLAVKLTALFWILLGIYFLRKTLLLFFNDQVAAISLFIIYTGTNSFITFFFGDLMPHLYLFTLNTLFLYYLIRFWNEKVFSYLLFAAFIFGLTTVIRPTQAIWGIIPFILLILQEGKSLKMIKLLMVFPLAVLLINIPQLLYWKIEGGSWIIMNLHNESLSFLHPYTLDFLFSYKKGWFIYSPIVLFSMLGMWCAYRKKKQLAIALISFFCLNIYVLSSWDCWWYAASYGSRVMVDSYVVVALLLGFFLQWIFSKGITVKVAFISISVFLIGLNVFQSLQFMKGIIPLERMTKDHYWYVFGKLNIPNYDESLQEINREDLNWDSTLLLNNSNAKKKGYSFSRKQLYQSNEVVYLNEKKEFVDITSFFPLKELPTDEVKLTISFESEIYENNKSVLLTCGIEGSKPYYFYYFPLANSANTMQFTLPIIRQSSDRLKLYVFNPEKKKGWIKNIRITAKYLVRTP